MKQDRENYIKGVMDGSDRSVGTMLTRVLARCAEPFYAGTMRARNGFYDAGLFKSFDLGRPTISVGNITTGGTGKTPVVCWIAGKMQAGGKHPVILIRGYKRNADGISDEQTLLQNALPNVPVVANPDRIQGAKQALEKYPATDLFILDDGMQHRRARRQFEIVLINALNPFGYDHVLPRGMLREPMSGLKRADAIILTHAGEAKDFPAGIEAAIRKFNVSAPIFKSDHRLRGFRSSDGEFHPAESLKDRSYFAFCGIGSPESFFRQLEMLGGKCVGTKAFADHHDYGDLDLVGIKSNTADVFIVTEKDWVKMAGLKSAKEMVNWRAELGIEFWDDHGERLLEMLDFSLTPSPSGRRLG